MIALTKVLVLQQEVIVIKKAICFLIICFSFSCTTSKYLKLVEDYDLVGKLTYKDKNFTHTYNLHGKEFDFRFFKNNIFKYSLEVYSNDKQIGSGYIQARKEKDFKNVSMSLYYNFLFKGEVIEGVIYTLDKEQDNIVKLDFTVFGMMLKGDIIPTDNNSKSIKLYLAEDLIVGNIINKDIIHEFDMLFDDRELKGFFDGEYFVSNTNINENDFFVILISQTYNSYQNTLLE